MDTKRYRSIRWSAQPFAESTDLLSNPDQGFYHLFRYALSDDSPADTPQQAAAYSQPLALLEINLKSYRKGVISRTGLAQLDGILSAWANTPTRLILRFLYDWDGRAIATEPISLGVILTHIDQIAPVVNRHRAAVYLMQGSFTGNWGEMHHSRFSDDRSIRTILNRLHRAIDPAVFLSVRTPAQWRMVNGVSQLPASLPAQTLMGRLGLFNDGILGSENDLGSYDSRDEELAFQNALCRHLPNGGEVVYHPGLCGLEFSVASLRTMHVSYLNADHDRALLDTWRSAVWTGDDPFHGCDGLHYIQAHLGFRLLIRGCRVQKAGWFRRGIRLTLTLENTGFSAPLRPLRTQLLAEHMESGRRISLPLPIDLRQLESGQTRDFTAELPVEQLPSGCCQLTLSVTDEAGNRPILLANQGNRTKNGYKLGQLDL